MSDPTETSSLNPEQASRIRQVFADLPEDYAGRRAALLSTTAAFGAELATQLQPALNAHIRSLPHATFGEKKELAKLVNGELRQFGLAIKCPKTGRPSILVAGPGHHPDSGRFQLENLSPEGKRVRTYNTPYLVELDLTPDSPRKEGLAKWADRISPAAKQEGYEL